MKIHRVLWLIPIVVALGIAGLSTGELYRIRQSARLVLKGPFWEGRNGAGALLIKEKSQHTRLAPNETLHVLEARGKDLIYKEFSFKGRRETGRAFFEAAFHLTGGKSLVLIVGAGSGPGIHLARQGRKGKLSPFADYEGPDLAGRPGRPLEVRLKMGAHGLTVTINGKEAIKTNLIIRTGGSFTLTARGGPCRLKSMKVQGGTFDGQGKIVTFNYKERFTALSKETVKPAVAAYFYRLGLVLLGLGIFLGSFCPGRLPLNQLMWAWVLLLFPASVYFAMPWFMPVSFFSLPIVFLAPIGTILALHSLSGPLRAPERAGWVGHSRALLVTAVLAALAAYASGDYGARLHVKDLAAERKAQTRTPSTAPSLAATFSVPKKTVLKPDQVLIVPRRLRNLNLKGTAVLEEGAVLKVRLRATNPRKPKGITLHLSSDPAFETRFFLEDGKTLHPIGKGFGTLKAKAPLKLWITARGRQFNADINGECVASAKERRFAEGGVMLLTEKGSAELEGLRVEPAAWKEIPVSPFPDRILWAAAPLAFLLFFALATSFLTGMRFLRILEPAAFGLLPLSAGLFRLSVKGNAELELMVWTVVLSAIPPLAFLVANRRTLGVLRRILLLAIVLFGCAWIVQAFLVRAG